MIDARLVLSGTAFNALEETATNARMAGPGMTIDRPASEEEIASRTNNGTESVADADKVTSLSKESAINALLVWSLTASSALQESQRDTAKILSLSGMVTNALALLDTGL